MHPLRLLVLLVAMPGQLLAPAARAAAPEIPGGAALPVPLAPANGAETTGNPDDLDATRLRCAPLGIPTLSWENTGASRYELGTATTQPSGDSIVLKRDDLQYPTYTPTGTDETGGGLGLDEEGDKVWWRAETKPASALHHIRMWTGAEAGPVHPC